MLDRLTASAVRWVLMGLCGLASFADTSAAEVRWRTNYDQARREAEQTGRALLLDFGTSACIWCKRLDATTFRTPAVVDRLNQSFIPVKIDADQLPQLVRALAIQSYPTLIVAGPNGQILARQEGYVEAPGMLKLLDDAMAKIPRAHPASGGVQPASAVMPAPTPSPAPPGASAVSPAPGLDPTRVEINRKLAQVYFERGQDLYRQGRVAEGEQYLNLAVVLSPTASEADQVRTLLQQLRSSSAPREK